MLLKPFLTATTLLAVLFGCKSEAKRPASANLAPDSAGLEHPGGVGATKTASAQQVSFASKDLLFRPSQSASPPADFLFVFDNTPSMEKVLQRLSASFEKLSPTTFPSNSRIGVISTLLGDPADLSKPHPALNSYKGIELEPGFLRLVDAVSVVNFRAEQGKAGMNPTLAGRFAEDGCTAWFQPGATNTTGTPCLRAHLQSALADVGCRAGTRALAQLIDKSASSPLFRDRAVVNVIFVSTAHDPGCTATTLTDLPTPEILAQKIVANTPLVWDARFNGVVPDPTVPVESRLPDLCPSGTPGESSYYPFVDATGGKRVDVCSNDNYDAFARTVAETRNEALPEIAFSAPIERVVQVTVNGKAYSAFGIVAEKTVRLKTSEGVDFRQDTSIQVTVSLKVQ